MLKELKNKGIGVGNWNYKKNKWNSRTKEMQQLKLLNEELIGCS